MKPYRIQRINGVLYETMLHDVEEVFRRNRIVRLLLDTSKMDLNDIWNLYGNDCVDIDEIVGLYAALGYGVDMLPDSLYETLTFEDVVPPKDELPDSMQQPVKELLVKFAQESLLNITNSYDPQSELARKIEVRQLMTDIKEKTKRLGFDFDEIESILSIAVQAAYRGK